MRVLVVMLIIIACLTPYVIGSGMRDRDPGIMDLSPCGLQCLLYSIPTSNCSITDIECQCRSKEMLYATADCMLTNCTMAETLDTAKVQASLCKLPHESKSHQIDLTNTAVFSITLVSIAVRLAAKVMGKRIFYDDYFILGALVFGTVSYGCICRMVREGAGRHVWDLEHGQLKDALRLFYIAGNAYQIALGLAKMSLVALYLQIFRTRKTRLACFALLAFITLCTLAIAFATIFSCSPIRGFWNRDVKSKCINLTALGFANSASAIVQDILIILLPMPSLHTLNIKPWRKVAVGIMFALGTCGCIATIIRLRTVFDLKVSIDPTWDYSELIIWTALELAVIAVCASLPSIRVFLAIILEKTRSSFGSGRKYSAGAAKATSNRVQRRGFSMISTSYVSAQDSYTVPETSSDKVQSESLVPGDSSFPLIQLPERSRQPHQNESSKMGDANASSTLESQRIAIDAAGRLHTSVQQADLV